MAMKRLVRILTLVNVFFFCALGEVSSVENPDVKTPALSEKNILKEIQSVDEKLNSERNIWLKKYMNLERHNGILKQLEGLNARLEILRKNPKANALEIQQIEIRIDSLTKSLEILGVNRENPFKELLVKPEIGENVEVKSPFAIISALGFMKKLDNTLSALRQKEELLNKTLELLERKQTLLLDYQRQAKKEKLQSVDATIESVQNQILEFKSAQNILQTTSEIFEKNYQETILKLKNQMKNQIIKLVVILTIILLSVLLVLLSKMILRRYLGDSERYYTMAKVMNFLHITLVVLIVMFAYLDNVTYLVTFLGFASAGLAIAMKDLFMSLLGWCVILIGGSIRVGDRIKILKEGSEFLGDVLDISALRITLYEDVSLQSMQEHRAGRIIFIPNHYIFNTMVANYTHGGLKSVWDGIEFTLTFDSNIERAKQLAKEIVSKHISIDSVRREFGKLRTRYGMKIPDLNVRIFTLMENNGMKICLWYPASVHSALQLKSLISLEIIEAFLQEKDIHISYTTTKLIKDGRDGFGNKMVDSFPIEI